MFNTSGSKIVTLVLTLDGIIAYDIIPGSVTSDLFVNFLHDVKLLIISPNWTTQTKSGYEASASLATQNASIPVINPLDIAWVITP